MPAADTVCATKPLPGDKKVYVLEGPVGTSKAATGGRQAEGPAPANARVREIRDQVGARIPLSVADGPGPGRRH